MMKPILGLFFLLLNVCCLVKTSHCRQLTESKYVDLLLEVNEKALHVLGTIDAAINIEGKKANNHTFGDLSKLLRHKAQDIYKDAIKIHRLHIKSVPRDSRAKENIEDVLVTSKELVTDTAAGGTNVTKLNQLKTITAKLLIISYNIKDLAQDYYYQHKYRIPNKDLMKITRILLNYSVGTSKAIKILINMGN